jgi:hypothetical protein
MYSVCDLFGKTVDGSVNEEQGGGSLATQCNGARLIYVIFDHMSSCRSGPPSLPY